MQEKRKSINSYKATIKDVVVNIADRPIVSQEDVKNIKTISASDFAESRGMTVWCDFGLVVDDGRKILAKPITAQANIADEDFQHLKKEIVFNSNKLVISDMGSAGYGVFVNGTLPKGAFLCLYTGHYSFFEESVESECFGSAYNFPLGLDETPPRCFNAADYGNISRFLQHLPNASAETDGQNPVSLSTYTFSSCDISNKVATANVAGILLVHQGAPFIAFTTTREVQFEQVGYDYGMNYWISQQTTPCLFDKWGQVVPPTSYSVSQPYVIITWKSQISGEVDNEFYRKLTLDQLKSQCQKNSFLLFPVRRAGKDINLQIPKEKVISALQKQKTEGSFFLTISMCEEKPIERKVVANKSSKLLIDFTSSSPRIFDIPFKKSVEEKKVAEPQTALTSTRSHSVSPIYHDSPIASPIGRIKASLASYKTKNTDAFFKAFDSAHYNKALRIACNSQSSEALLIAQILVSNHAVLDLNPNEKAGEKQLSAFHFAEMNGGKEIYKLLLTIDADHRKIERAENSTLR